MIPLTDEEHEFHEKQKFVTYTKKNLILMKMMKMIKINLIQMKMIKMH